MKYIKGQSGNLGGRPRGTVNKYAVFKAVVSPHERELMKKALDMALDGNEAMMKLILERIMPAKPTIDASGEQVNKQNVIVIQQIMKNYEKEF